MSRNCSQCGNNGHNSRTCTEVAADNSFTPKTAPAGGFMLFGVRVTEGSNSIRKSVSLNDLSQYEQPQEPNPDLNTGYASDDVVHNSVKNRERKRGVPWTEEEHRSFLLGLEKVGKGDWRGISRNFVKTRTPTQVASHAQKYFLRKCNQNRRRRRSSLFDITSDSYMEEEESQEPKSQEMNCNLGFTMQTFPVICPEKPVNVVRPIPVIPAPPVSRMADLDLNQASTMDPSPLSINILNSFEKQTATRHSAFQAMFSLSGENGDCSGGNMIRVA